MKSSEFINEAYEAPTRDEWANMSDEERAECRRKEDEEYADERNLPDIHGSSFKHPKNSKGHK